MQPSTRTRSPLSSSISIMPDVRVAFRRRVGRFTSVVAGFSVTSTGVKVSAGAALGSDRLSVMRPFASAWRLQPNS